MSQAASGDPELVVRRENGVVRLTMNRLARRNALTDRGWHALHRALREIDPAVDRVLVISGAGVDFCAGADLSDPDQGALHLDRVGILSEACLTLFRLPVPTIARVDGVAVGAGLNLALACDFLVATHRARFSEIFVRRGLSVDFGGSWLLPRLVGMHTAKRLVLLGEILDAASAQELGLVNRLVAPDELDAEVARLVDRLLSGAPMAIRLCKQLLNTSFESSLDQALSAENAAQAVNLSSRDATEAAEAFLAKREPEFRGS
jgi:2-(1,2-epoxy-1,2-dihydrophenyl)acetyl-CoA isomerase